MRPGPILARFAGSALSRRCESAGAGARLRPFPTSRGRKRAAPQQVDQRTGYRRANQEQTPVTDPDGRVPSSLGSRGSGQRLTIQAVAFLRCADSFDPKQLQWHIGGPSGSLLGTGPEVETTLPAGDHRTCLVYDDAASCRTCGPAAWVDPGESV